MKSLSPNDYRKIYINKYVKTAKEALVKFLVNSDITANGVGIDIATSKTTYGGHRLWFSCPKCNRRCGILYEVGKAFICVKCFR